MAVQTTYNETMGASQIGAIVSTEPKTLVSRTVETAAGIGFGVPVSQGSDDKGCVVTSGNTDIVGVTVQDRSTSPETPDTFAQYQSALVMLKGVVWVTAGEAVAAGDPVYVTMSTGAFKKTASGNVAIPNARFDTSAASGALVQLRLG